MSIPDSIIESVGPIVESCAAQLSRKYRRYGGEQADLAQEGWLWVYSHPRKVIDWYDRDTYSERESEKLLARALRNEMKRFGEELKAQHLGYSTDDLSYYSKAYVEQLLPSVFDEDAWMFGAERDDEDAGTPRSKGDPAQGGNWIATLADVSRAVDQLEPEDRDLIHWLVEDDWTQEMVADALGIHQSTVSKRFDRVLHRLVEKLGGYKPQPEHDEDCPESHWSGRRAMSNAAARAAQQSYYEED